MLFPPRNSVLATLRELTMATCWRTPRDARSSDSRSGRNRSTSPLQIRNSTVEVASHGWWKFEGGVIS